MTTIQGTLTPPECGTNGAYTRRRRRRETCDMCERAHAEQIDADRRRRLAAEHDGGGSRRGYQIHQQLGEPACTPCRGAMSRVSAARRAAA